MSHLTVYPENDSSRPLIDTSDFEEITEALGGAGILIERCFKILLNDLNAIVFILPGSRNSDQEKKAYKGCDFHG